MTAKCLVTGGSKVSVAVRCGLIFLASFVLAGCGGPDGPPRAAVEGTVTLDGKPLAAGMVRFVPKDGTPGQKVSVSIEAGKFSVGAEHGPPVGAHRIEIESSDTGGLAMDDEDVIDKMQAEGIRRVKVVKVPPWYNRESKLAETVSASEPNQYVFELSTKRRR